MHIQLKIILFILVHLICVVDRTFGQNACRTPYNEAGSCTRIQDCNAIWRIVTDAPRPLDQRVLDFLQKSTCGRPEERRVCCRSQDLQENGAGSTVAATKPPTQATNEVTNHPNLRFLDTVYCGPISSDRIAHGNETVLYEFPWMALLGYEDGGSIDWKCGGSVISKRYVLTAAHCVTNLRSGVRLTTVRLGEYDVSKDIDCMTIGTENQCTPPVQDIGVQRAIAHPGFNRPKWANDIALIRMSQEADFSQFAVAAICLPVTSNLMQLQLDRVTVTGWGTTETQQRSDRLLKADIRYVPRTNCEQTLKVALSAGQLCAGGSSMEDSCSGDSGGPLQFPASLTGTKYVQFGVVSFGITGCGNRQAQPGVYADVRYYLKWILDMMQP